MMMKAALLASALLGVATAQQVIPGDFTFGQTYSMSFVRGTGDANDVLVSCAAQTTAADAATETSTQTITTTPAGTADYSATSAYAYFLAVVQQNQPYTPDGSESQAFIDMYICSTTLTVGFNGTPLDYDGTGGATDFAAGQHACNAQIGMDYGGNPSCAFPKPPALARRASCPRPCVPALSDACFLAQTAARRDAP